MTQNNGIVLSQFSLDEIANVISQAVRLELLAIKEKEVAEELLSPEETCQMFKPRISKVTLHNWTKEGRLQDYKIGGRKYYKRSEILQAVERISRYKRSI